MKRIYPFILACAIAMTAVVLVSANSAHSVQWRTDYQQALSDSSKSGKPVLLFFTGSDWCVYCKRLEKEVFQTQEFANAAGNSYIFVVVDTPMNFDLAPDLEEQNERLVKRFNISQYPTVLLLNDNEKIIASAGYRTGGGKRYAAYLQKLAGNPTSPKR